MCDPQSFWGTVVKTGDRFSHSANRLLLYVLAYLLWLISVIVCVVTVIQLRDTINVLWAVFGGDRYSLGLVNQLSLLLGGFVAFVYVVFLEGYYSQSVAPQSLASVGETPGPVDHTVALTTSLRGRIAGWLTRLGLAVLLRRFVVTMAIPLGVLTVSLLVLEIALRFL